MQSFFRKVIRSYLPGVVLYENWETNHVPKTFFIIFFNKFQLRLPLWRKQIFTSDLGDYRALVAQFVLFAVF